jgi:hypothetical protein
MNEEIQQSLAEIARAMENLNRAFEKRLEDLQKLGDADADALQQWLKATQAMRDSGNIYLTWAKHYARSASVNAAEDDPEDTDFLDEGSI